MSSGEVARGYTTRPNKIAVRVQQVIDQPDHLANPSKVDQVPAVEVSTDGAARLYGRMVGPEIVVKRLR